MSGAAKPPDFVIVLAVSLFGDSYVVADEVRGQLKRLGFDASTQQVAAWLQRIARKDLPPVKTTTEGYWGGVWGYRLTQWGWTELWNRGFKNLGMPVAFPHKRETDHAS